MPNHSERSVQSVVGESDAGRDSYSTKAEGHLLQDSRERLHQDESERDGEQAISENCKGFSKFKILIIRARNESHLVLMQFGQNYGPQRPKQFKRKRCSDGHLNKPKRKLHTRSEKFMVLIPTTWKNSPKIFKNARIKLDTKMAPAEP